MNKGVIEILGLDEAAIDGIYRYFDFPGVVTDNMYLEFGGAASDKYFDFGGLASDKHFDFGGATTDKYSDFGGAEIDKHCDFGGALTEKLQPKSWDGDGMAIEQNEWAREVDVDC